MGIVLELPSAAKAGEKGRKAMGASKQVRQCVVEVLVQDAAWETALPGFEPAITKAVESALLATDLFKYIFTAECSVMLANDAVIRDLNKQFRAKDRPTNVLSFPSHAIDPLAMDAVARLEEHPLYLGDIIISHETATREAEEQGKDFKNHVLHLAVHAALHLLGYDHKTESDAAVMEPLEVKILSGLGVNDPYLWYEKK